MEYELEGIIIKKQNINDFDQIVTVVSNRGKFSFFAPSVKKENSKNGLNLNTLSLVNFEIIESQKRANLLPRLKRANTIISFPINVMLKQEYIDLEFFLNKINSIKWQNFI
ncbi:DNA repair protein RecO, partial [Metamycoplasma equirhinis]